MQKTDILYNSFREAQDEPLKFHELTTYQLVSHLKKEFGYTEGFIAKNIITTYSRQSLEHIIKKWGSNEK